MSSAADRSEQALAIALTVIMVLSMIPASAVGAGHTADSSTAGETSGASGSETATETPDSTTADAEQYDATRNTTLLSTDGRGNTGFQPWYLYLQGVNTANGNLFRSTEDIAIGARGDDDITFVRTYNSHASAEHGPLGFGWTHSYAMRLVERSDGSVLFIDEDGSRHTFTPADGGYEPPAGVHARLRTAGDGFELDRLNGETLRFDDDGRLQWIEDRNGNREILEYTDGDLTTIRDESGQQLTLEYSEEGRISSIVDPLNRTIQYRYSAGNLVEVVGLAGDTTTYGYYENHKLQRVSSPSNITTRYTYYNDTGRVRCADSGQLGAPCTRTGTSFEYDYANDTVDVADVLARESYDLRMNDAGNPTVLRTPNQTVRTEWDAEMNRVEVSNATGTYTYSYDEFGNLIERTGPEGDTISKDWRTVRTGDSYYSVLTSRTSPKGLETTYRYDDSGNRIAVVDPAGRTRRMRYDEYGNVVSRIDAGGDETTYTYDEHGFRTSMTDPTGATTTYSHDAIGRLLNRTGPRGNTYMVEYNERGDIVEQTSPDGSTVELYYDDSGTIQRLVRSVGENGTRSSIPPQPGTGVGADYDLEVDEGTSTVTRTKGDRRYVLQYTSRGRLDSKTVDYGPFTRTLDYTYDADGNPVAIETPAGTIRNEFDSLDRLTRTEGPDGSWVEYTYGNDSNTGPTEIAYSTGASVAYEYDAAGRTAGLRAVGGNGSVLINHSYTYDDAGNRRMLTDGDGNVTRYEYDERNRLTRVAYPSGKTVAYTYDAIGNRLSKTVNGTETTRYEYDSDGKLLRAGDISYEYDANGNVRARIDGSGRTEYDYTPTGRLAEAQLPNGETVSFSYLPSGERLSKTTADGTTYYLYSQSHVVGTFDEDGTLERHYLREPGVDGLAGFVDDGEFHAYVQDARNNVRVVTNGNGSAVNRYRYSPYGGLRNATERVGNDYQFAGRRYDDATGLYYNRMRYYDPAVGRFTRQDPAGIRAGPNLYSYARGNPIKSGDPSGLASDTWECSGVTSGGMVIAAGLESFEGRCKNKRTGQSCRITKYCGKLGLGLGGSVGFGGGSTSGPECGKDFEAQQSYNFGGCVGGSFYGIGAQGCAGTGGVGGSAGVTGGHGVEAEVGFSLCDVPNGGARCGCVPECEEDGDCGNEPPPPPGNDHPDDAHDPSLQSFDRSLDRSSISSYRYDPSVAVLNTGFNNELEFFLQSVNESSYHSVRVNVSRERLDRYDVLIIPTGGLMGLESYPPFERKLERFVDDGGTLVVLPQQRGYQFELVPGQLRGYGWIEDQSCQFRSVGMDEYCPIISSQTDQLSEASGAATADINVDGYFTEYPDDAEILLTRRKNRRPSMLKYGYGNGTVIASNAYTDWAYGHNAWNPAGKEILRDTVRWARGPQNLTTYNPGEETTLEFQAQSYVDMRVDRIELQLYRPNPRTKCRRSADGDKFNCFEVPRRPPMTVNASGGLAPLESRNLSTQVEIPPRSEFAQAGIWRVGYALYNDSHGRIQQVNETHQFAVSRYEDSFSGYQRPDSNITVSLSSDAENYASGSNATFTIILRNDGPENETVSFWWSFPHNYWNTQDPIYGAGTTAPARENSALNRTVTVPAGEEVTVRQTIPVSYTDRLWLQAYEGTNRSGEYIGRSSRAFFTFNPEVDVAVSANDSYGLGRNSTVDVALQDAGFDRVTVETLVLAPDNTLVKRSRANVSFAESQDRANLSVGVTPSQQSGHYTVIAEALDDEADRIGYDSTTFEVPFGIRADATLPATLDETNRVNLSVENFAATSASNVSLAASLRTPTEDVAWNRTVGFDLNGTERRRVVSENATVPDLRFGTYELRYTLRYGGEQVTQTRRVERSATARGSFDDPRYSQRDTASATVTIENDGRFIVDSNATVVVPAAEYEETRSISLNPDETTTQAHSIPLPDDIPAGTHDAVVTVGPTEANPVTTRFSFTVPQSDLRLDVEQGTFTTGESVTLSVRNVGGVDTYADCGVRLVGPGGQDLPANDLQETIRPNETVTSTVTVPEQAISGEYFVDLSCTDPNTGDTTETTETIDVDGLSADLATSTDRNVYNSGETVTITAEITNDGAAIQNGTLYLEITDPSTEDGTSGTTTSSLGARSVAVDEPDRAPSLRRPRGAADRMPSLRWSRESANRAPSLGRSRESADRTPSFDGSYTASVSGADSTTEPGRLGGPPANDFDATTLTASGIDNETVWRDRTVTMNESLVVNATGNLTLVNTTLQFEGGEFDTDLGAEVRDGGELHVRRNSTVRKAPFDSDIYVRARPGSTLTLRNSTVQDVGQSFDGLESSGTYVATDDATIRNVTFRDSTSGLILHGTTGLTVANNQFVDTRDRAVHLRDSRDTVVRGNTIRGSKGVLLGNASDNEIRNNTLTEVTGIELRGGSDRNVVADNDLSALGGSFDDGTIVVAENANYTTVARNDITDSNGGRAILARGNHTVLRGNEVSQSAYDGIQVTGRNVTLENNTVVNSDSFGVLLTGAESATLRDNSMDSFHVAGEEGARPQYPDQLPALRHYDHDIDTSNTVDGRPLRYLFGETDATVANDGEEVWLAGATNVTVRGSGPVSVARSTDVSVRDLRVQSQRYGLLLLYANGTTVSNVTARQNEFGILLAGAQDEGYARANTIEGSTIANNTRDGVHAYYVADTVIRDNVLPDNEENGFHLNGRNLTVSRNEVTGGRDEFNDIDGAIIAELTNSTLSGNVIREVRDTGIYVTDPYQSAGNNTVSGNEVTDVPSAIELLASDSVVVDNEIRNGRYQGIDVESDNVTLRGNRISGHRTGISGDGANDLDVRANVVSNNEVGISVGGGFGGSIVRSVTIADNRGSNNSEIGIRMGSTRDSVLRNNSVAGAEMDLALIRTRGTTLRENSLPGAGLWVERGYRHDIDTSNTIDGRPIRYLLDARDVTVRAGGSEVWLVNATNATVRGSGGVTLIDTENAMVRNVTATNRTIGVHLLRTTNSTVANVTAADSDEFNGDGGTGLRLDDSRRNELEDVTVLRSEFRGIRLADQAGNNTLRNVLTKSNNGYGIRVREGNENTFRNITAVANGRTGIWVDSDGNTLRNVTIRNSEDDGIDVSGAENRLTNIVAAGNRYGVSLGGGDAANNTLQGVTVRNNRRDGLTVSTGSSVRDVLAVGNREGIAVYGDDLTVRNVTALRNDQGINVGQDNRNVTLRNVTARNGSVGVYSVTARNLTVLDSRFRNNGAYGIELHGVKNGTYRGNVFRGNGRSVYIGRESGYYGGVRSISSGNLFYDNYFESGVQRDDPGAENNSWNVTKRLADTENIVGGPFLGGNYWPGYTGTDTDGDGLGDTDLPHAFGDYHPLVTEEQTSSVWRTNVSVDVAAGATETVTVEVPASELPGSGKQKLSGRLDSRSDQIVAFEDPSFYVFDGDTVLTLETDERIYTTGDTATVSGTLTNDGSTDRTYSLSVTKNGTEILGDSVTLAPGASHSYQTTTEADGPFSLSASAGDVTVGDTIDVGSPSVDATLLAPDVAGREPVDVGVMIENTGEVPAEVSVTLAPTGETWNVTLGPGEQRLLKTSLAIDADTTVEATLGGDVSRTLTKRVEFGEDATVSVPSDQLHAPGQVTIPYTAENTGRLESGFNVTFTVAGQTTTEAVYLRPDGSTSGSATFALPAGEYTLETRWPFGNTTTNVTVAEADQLEMTVTEAGTPGDGTVERNVTLSNVGSNAVNGTLRANASVFTVTRGFDLDPGEETTIPLSVDLPEGVAAGTYDVGFEAERGGSVLVERTDTFEAPGPSFELVSGPSLGTYGLGEEVTVNATVANTGSTGGRTSLNVTVPGIDEASTSTWIPSGERETLSVTFRVPEGLDTDTYDVFYEVNGTQRRTFVTVEGADVAVDAELDQPSYTADETATATLTVSSERPIETPLFARVKFNGNETVKTFSLNETTSETLQFEVPIRFDGDEKIFYGVYADTGRSLYISGLYPHQERENVTLWTDEQIYEPGDTVTVTVETDRRGEVRISAPDRSSWVFTVAPGERATRTFEVPPLGSGTYYVHYSFEGQSYSYPIDVEGYGVTVRDVSLEKDVYEAGDTVGLGLELVPTRNVSGTVTATVLDESRTPVARTRTNVSLTTGRNRVTLRPTLPTNASGPHTIRYAVDADVEGRSVLGAEGLKYMQVDPAAGLANRAPVAAVDVSPELPLAGQTVTLDASGSQDPDGNIARYEWDFDADDAIDATGPQVTTTFPASGSYTVTLRVIDDQGETNTTTRTVRVNPLGRDDDEEVEPTPTPTTATPTPTPAGAVEIADRSLLEDTTTPETVAVRVTVRNPDQVPRAVILNLTANDTTVGQRTLEVDAGAERTVTLRHAFAEAGRYVVGVNGVSVGTVTVGTGTETTASTGTTTPTAPPTPTVATSSRNTGSETATATPTATPTPTPSAAPTASPTRSGTATTADGPGLGPLAVLVALLLLVGVGRLRRRD